MLKLRESGDLQKLHKRWWYDKGECAPENEAKVDRVYTRACALYRNDISISHVMIKMILM